VSPTTSSENYAVDVEVDGIHVGITLWDTSGVPEYDRLGPLSYPDTHVILLCFGIDNPDLLENVEERVSQPIYHFCYLG